jgi:hypothetical protein
MRKLKGFSFVNREKFIKNKINYKNNSIKNRMQNYNFIIIRKNHSYNNASCTSPGGGNGPNNPNNFGFLFTLLAASGVYLSQNFISKKK